MGYDVSEVLTFLADVERTLTGEETDPERVVTAQKALDVEFSAKLRGFNDEEVDAARHPEPGDDRVLTLGVDHCLEEQDALSALLVVVGGLKKPRGLTGVHGAVAEVELGHAGPPEPDRITRAGCYPPSAPGAGKT